MVGIETLIPESRRWFQDCQGSGGKGLQSHQFGPRFRLDFPTLHLRNPEQVRGSEATEAESKDPENTSSAMRRQGVLLTVCRANIFGPRETAITTLSGFTSWEAEPEPFTRE